jgi:hypothetical protein
MLTFQQIGDEAAAQVEDTTTATRILIDRAINQGALKFGAVLNREVRVEYRTFTTVAQQQNYQMPENAIRPKTITVTVGGVLYPLTECADEDQWNRLNESVSYNDMPEFYHVRGSDLFGIWPIPSAGGNTAEIGYESRMKRMSALDYITGTIAVTTNSQAVVGTTTTFTAQMVGRTLVVQDAGDNDGIPYKISAFTDTTHITLENYYNGLTGSGKSYVIGEVPDIPDEFHESLVDYALYRVYKRRRDRGMAKDCKAAFDEAVVLCQQTYSSASASQYARPVRVSFGYIHRRRDYTVS